MAEIEIPARLSLKAGYFLTDVTRRDMGNFWVIPGSHRTTKHRYRSSD